MCVREDDFRCCPECLLDWDECECACDCDECMECDDYDGQPDEWTEWQDVYGGDEYEYGTYGDYDNGEDW